MEADVRSTMRITRLLTLFTLIVGLTVGLSASPAAACSCMEPSDEQSFEFADAVFTGQIVEIREVAGEHVFIVDVDAVWKGDVDRWQTVTTALDGAACGIMLPSRRPSSCSATKNPAPTPTASACATRTG